MVIIGAEGAQKTRRLNELVFNPSNPRLQHITQWGKVPFKSSVGTTSVTTVNTHVSYVERSTFKATPSLCSIHTLLHRFTLKKKDEKEISKFARKTKSGSWEMNTYGLLSLEELKTKTIESDDLYQFQEQLDKWRETLNIAQNLAIDFLDVTGPFDIPKNITFVDVRNKVQVIKFQ